MAKTGTSAGRFLTSIIAVLGGLALVLATGLLFFEPQLSLMVYALSGIALFIGNHVSEQRKWEARTEDSIRTVRKRQMSTEEKIALTQERLNALTNKLESTIAKDSSPQRTEMQRTPAPSPLLTPAPAPVVSQSQGGGNPAPQMRSIPAAAREKPRAPISAPPVHVVANDRRVKPHSGAVAGTANAGKSFHDTLSDIVIKELVQHAVKKQEIAMFAQPIVRLPHGEVRFFEVFGRVQAREGSYIPASRFLKFARKDGIVGQVDHQVLTHCLREIKRAHAAGSAAVFFMNVAPRSIKNSAFMNQLLLFLSKNQSLAKNLVIEIPQALFSARDKNTDKILQGLKALGCSFSIDQISSIQFNVNDLHASQVRFVKIPAKLMIETMKNPRAMNNMVRAKRLLESNGIGVIVEKVESDAMLQSLAGFGIHYAQGYHFGRPHSYTHSAPKRAA